MTQSVYSKATCPHKIMKIMTLCTDQPRVGPVQNIAILSTHTAFSPNLKPVVTQKFV